MGKSTLHFASRMQELRASDIRENTLRLNFSAMPEERITEGIRRLGRVLSSVVAHA